jgi:hypothetical protein
VMLMPAASSVAWFSPTARRCRPVRLRRSIQPAIREMTIAR